VQSNTLTAPVTTPPLLLLTSRQAAHALSISPRLLWQLTEPRGPIRVLRLSGRGSARALRYDVRDLLAWIDGAKGPTEENVTAGTDRPAAR